LELVVSPPLSIRDIPAIAAFSSELIVPAALTTVNTEDNGEHGFSSYVKL